MQKNADAVLAARDDGCSDNTAMEITLHPDETPSAKPTEQQNNVVSHEFSQQNNALDVVVDRDVQQDNEPPNVMEEQVRAVSPQ